MLLIDDDRCVHRLATAARCDRCVQVCPRSAWSMDAQGLGFDADACDGCGLCVTACPTGALATPAGVAADPAAAQPVGAPQQPSAAPAPAKGEWALACAPALGEVPTLLPGVKSVAARLRQATPGSRGADDAASILPCLHGVDEAALLERHRNGWRRLAVFSADCRHCPRGRNLLGGQRLPDRLAAVNRVLQARGSAGWSLRVLDQPLPQWQAAEVRTAAVPAEEPAAARRALLGLRRHLPAAAGGSTSANPSEPPDALPTPQRVLATELLRDVGPAGPALWAVRLQPARCDACGACASLCPTAALALETGTDRWPALRLSMGACIGCGLCVDVCAPGALLPAATGSEPTGVRRLNLTELKCSSCGKAYRALGASSPSMAQVCPACRGTAARRQDRIVQADAGAPTTHPDCTPSLTPPPTTN